MPRSSGASPDGALAGPGPSGRILAGLILAGLTLAGLPGCGDLPPGDSPPGSLEIAASAAPEEAPPAIQQPAAAAEASLFAAGRDGRLHRRTVELPEFSTTRGRAEALIRLLIEKSGTFPSGSRVLDVFVSGRGVAVVNFTLDLVEGHTGGLLAEELTVYSLSHSLVESFPAIAEVRLLVEGGETETLAGHLDLRSGFGRAPDRLLADPGGGGLRAER